MGPLFGKIIFYFFWNIKAVFKNFSQSISIIIPNKKKGPVKAGKVIIMYYYIGIFMVRFLAPAMLGEGALLIPYILDRLFDDT